PGDTTRMKASLLCALAAGCAAGNPSSYFDNAGRTDVGTGGIRRIEIDTPKGKFHVWTKRVGNNPSLKVLTLHGGPAATHEYFEVFDTHLPAAGIEYYYYDQLGSAYSDQPTNLRSGPSSDSPMRSSRSARRSARTRATSS